MRADQPIEYDQPLRESMNARIQRSAQRRRAQTAPPPGEPERRDRIV